MKQYFNYEFGDIEELLEGLSVTTTSSPNRLEYLQTIYELLRQHFVILSSRIGYLELYIKEVKTKKGRYELGVSLEQAQEHLEVFEMMKAYVKLIDKLSILGQSIAKTIVE